MHRLKTHDPATIKGIIEGRMNIEKFLERILTVVLHRALRFLPTIPLIGEGMPPMKWQ